MSIFKSTENTCVMEWKKKLFSNMFLRNLLADLGKRSAYGKAPGGFTPYFQYKIGSYQPDYYLYFPKSPFALQYQNEVFNKLNEYQGFDITGFLEFHYVAFPGKPDFLRFLHYESSSRFKRVSGQQRRLKLQTVLEWTLEKRQALQTAEPALPATEQDLRPLTGHEANGGSSSESWAQEFVQKLSAHTEAILTRAEERMEAITGVLAAGRIEPNNHNHLEKMIQLLILLQTVQSPGRRGEQLFKRFSSTDIAAILQLHFSPYKNLKVNTLQRKITEAGEQLKPTNPRVQQLNKALQDFFYE